MGAGFRREEHSPVLAISSSALFFYLLDFTLCYISEEWVSLACKRIFGYKPSSLNQTSIMPKTSKANASNGVSKSKDAAEEYHSANSNYEEHKWWKVRNVVLSWFHSFISGPVAILSVYLEPAMLDDIIGTYTSLAFSLVCFSLGYFVHDCIHMLRKKLSTETMELLLHHFLIFLTYGTALITRRYIAYAVVSLFMELNSIFLHARQLANMHGVPKSSAGYRLLSRINIGSFVAFRVLTTGWMVRWLAHNWRLLPAAVALLGAAGLATISVMNCVLLLRLLRSDWHCLLPSAAAE